MAEEEDFEFQFTEEETDRLWKMIEEHLPWATWWKPWRRCKAVKEPNASGYWGRCELDRDHNFSNIRAHHDHALERGFDIPRWSTVWTE